MNLLFFPVRPKLVLPQVTEIEMKFALNLSNWLCEPAFLKVKLFKVNNIVREQNIIEKN